MSRLSAVQARSSAASARNWRASADGGVIGSRADAARMLVRHPHMFFRCPDLSVEEYIWVHLAF
jgi:hypothetical protein